MTEFTNILKRFGYPQFYSFFGDGNLRMSDWMAGARGLPEPLRSLIHLFLLQQPVPQEIIRPLIGEEAVEILMDAGVLQEQGEHFVTGSFCLIPFRSFLYFCQINAEPWAYFGEDSIALATYQTLAPGGAVLDLCSGPGIQSLIAARAAQRVRGVEINPAASRLARLNQSMNGVGDHLQFINQSLEDYAANNSEAFDRVLFNPPLVPVPNGMAYPFVGHGGETGMSVTERILEAYTGALTPSGRFEFIGMTLGGSGISEKDDPLLSLARKHRLEGTIYILSKHRVQEDSALVNACAVSLAQSNGVEVAAARGRILSEYAEAEYEHYCLFFCSLGRASGRRRGSYSLVDMSFYHFGDWFA